MRPVKLYGTTDGSGDLTVNSEEFQMTRLVAVQWINVDFAAGVDAVLSTQESETAYTLLTLTDANASALYYPRTPMHDNAGTALTATAGGDNTMPLVHGKLRLVVSAGGDTKQGGVIVFLEQ